MGFRERVERRRWTMHIGDVVVEDPGGDAIVLGNIIVVPTIVVIARYFG